MNKKIFLILAVVGEIVILILSLIIPADPYETIPALTPMSFDKPLWFCIFVFCSLLHLIGLSKIYEAVNKDDSASEKS